MNTFHILASLLIVALASCPALAQSNGTLAPANTTIPITTTDTPAPTNSTTSPPTNSTTSPPTKSTTPAPFNTTISTAAPVTTPGPKEPTNTYNVVEGNDHCIQLTAKIDFVIKYNTTAGKMVSGNVAVPGKFKASGSCGNKTQTLSIAFFNGWNLVYTFVVDSDSQYHVSDIMLDYVLDSNLPNAAKPGSKMSVNISTGSDYMKGNKDGYICNSKIDKTSGDVTINTEDLKYKAFNSGPKIDVKSSGLECSADEDTNSIVPIAVGAALAGLVVIVLIAYLIGRKRTRKTGYESV